MAKLPPKTLKEIKNLVRDNEREKLHQVSDLKKVFISILRFIFLNSNCDVKGM
jgi:hypothetical protein